ncbi:MAG TPA: hypothetical protein VKF42_02985 [Chitinivibrionales bacterium]|jgi:hypothetical protein|nr:hypothetical protein [Chitinivibrionales bacterium]
MHQGTTPQNQIPRLGGTFYWEQAYNAISAGATMLYGAMFDEVDEGTAVLKACPKKSLAPSDGWWLTLDADGYNLPSDWYLRLTGCAKKMLNNQIPLSKIMPINPLNPDSGDDVHMKPSAQFASEKLVDMRNGILYLNLPADTRAEIALCRLDGTAVRTLQYRGTGGNSRVSLLTKEKFPSGMYLLSVRVSSRIATASIVSLIR